MSRLPGRQTFKTLRSPLRIPLRSPPRSPRYPIHLSSHHVHTLQTPFSGPPSYDTITRRFSSNSNPLDFFAEKRRQEAKDCGEYVDIHDVGGVDPNDFDVLITDVDDGKLRFEIAEVLGIQYLAKAAKADANKVVETTNGYLFGKKLRCVVSRGDKAHWVFFIVDTNNPPYFRRPFHYEYPFKIYKKG